MIVRLWGQSVCSLACFLLISSTALADATVNYQGTVVFSDLFGSGPVVNGFVIAGTFKPGFSPETYHCVYGDSSCNLEAGHYSAAVADGNFIPIGSGNLTDFGGGFSGSGATSAAPGTPIYLFAFETADPDIAFYWALATSTDSSYLVPADMGATTLNAITADMFVHGSDHPLGLALHVVPFPEPSTFVLAMGAASALLMKRRRQ